MGEANGGGACDDPRRDSWLFSSWLVILQLNDSLLGP